MQKTYISNCVKIVAFCVISSLSTASASEEVSDRKLDKLQPELFTLLNSLSPEDQEQCMKLLDETTQLIKETENNDTSEAEKTTYFYALFAKIASTRASMLCVKLLCAVIFWEIIKPYLEKNKETPFVKSNLELFSALVGAFFLDDIKDFFKEAKKMSEEKYAAWYTK